MDSLGCGVASVAPVRSGDCSCEHQAVRREEPTFQRWGGGVSVTDGDGDPGEQVDDVALVCVGPKPCEAVWLEREALAHFQQLGEGGNRGGRR